MANGETGRTGGSLSQRPAVAVWADYWLPLSETFIPNQMAAMQRWRPVTLGFRRLPAGLPVVPDLAPFTTSLPSRVLRRSLGARGHLAAYLDVLRDQRVEVVHAHFGPGAIHVLPIVRRSELPFVVTFHGYDVTRLPAEPGLRGRQYRAGLQQVFGQAERLVAVSEHVRSRLLDLGAPEDKICVRYLGAPGPPEGEAPTRDGRAGIVFVGRLIEKKGVADLLAAVARLPPDLRQTRVHILGSGDHEPALRRIAVQLGVDAVFRGHLTPREVAATLASAAVFCGPSKTARNGDTEGLPTAVIEAAHQGATIVATRHAGIPEFVRDRRDGLLVEEGDVAALSAALALALTDRALADELAGNAMRRARTDFELARCTAQLELLYDEVASDAAGRG